MNWKIKSMIRKINYQMDNEFEEFDQDLSSLHFMLFLLVEEAIEYE
jgi:hypothetical protein